MNMDKMFTAKKSLILVWMIIVLVVVACRPEQSVETSPTPEIVATSQPATLEPTSAPQVTPVPATATTPAETTATPMEPVGTLDEFIARLQTAVAGRDVTLLESLMADPFNIGYWLSEGVSLAPPEAADQLLNNLLAGEASVTWADPGLDLAPLLQGQPPATMLGPDKQVAAALLSYGWGPDGNGEAVQFITVQPDGTYKWELLLYAGSGFLSQPTTESAVVITADEATFYSGPGTEFEPVATVFGGMAYPVVGMSFDGQWWRLACYDDGNVRIPSCWVSADPAISEPTTIP
jgi:hypothetical protein